MTQDPLAVSSVIFTTATLLVYWLRDYATAVLMLSRLARECDEILVLMKSEGDQAAFSFARRMLQTYAERAQTIVAQYRRHVAAGLKTPFFGGEIHILQLGLCVFLSISCLSTLLIATDYAMISPLRGFADMVVAPACGQVSAIYCVHDPLCNPILICHHPIVGLSWCLVGADLDDSSAWRPLLQAPESSFDVLLHASQNLTCHRILLNQLSVYQHEYSFDQFFRDVLSRDSQSQV